MESLELALALIRDRQADGSRWLMQAIGCQPVLNLICGGRLEDESFRETVTREVAWQMDLSRDRDFLVSNMAQINLEFVGSLPGRAEEIRMQVAFYSVDLYRQTARDRVQQRDDLIWVPSEILCQETHFEGRLINPFHQSLINRGKVIEAWH
jgi:hypothetical protein